MNRIRKKHLSTLHTARVFANLLLFVGVIILPIVWIWIEYSALVAGKFSIEIVNEISDETATDSVSRAVYVTVATFAAFMAIWAGYTLKSIVVLAETQLHDTSPTGN